jgi:integrase
VVRADGPGRSIDYRNPQGERIQKVVRHATCWQGAHEALRNTIFREFYTQNRINKQKREIKFKDFADMYLRNYSMVKKRAWRSADRIYLNANLIPYFGEYELAKINSLLIEQFITKRVNDGLRKSTINRDLSCLKKMFNKAIDWNYLSENPLKKVKMFSEKDNVRDRILSEEEEARLLEESSEHLRSIIVVALNTGMRLGEILNLQWNQVDLRNKRIQVEKTKSGKSRFIPVNDVLLKEPQVLRSGDGQTPYLFTNPKTGKALATIKTAFNAACRRSGIKGLWFHDLRRTFATRLLQNGVDIITAQNLLGHHSVVVTERYLHTNEDTKRRAVEMLVQVKNIDSLVTNW